MNRYRQMRGVFNMYDDPISPTEDACLRYTVNWNRQMRGLVQDI